MPKKTMVVAGAALSAKQILEEAEKKATAERQAARVDDPERLLLDPELDLGNMVLREENDLDLKVLAGGKGTDVEAYLTALARDNAQLLVNSLWGLDAERIGGDLCVKLPPGSTVLPRAKPVPKPKPPTKWEQFAKSKGIVKRKSKGGSGEAPRLKWDDTLREWVPSYGYKRAQAETKKTWMMEIKDNQDPMVDPFEKAVEDKRERIAKNELQRLRNIARAKNVKLPGASGLLPLAPGSRSVSGKKELLTATELAKKSTASLGKFQEKLEDPKLQKAAVEAGAKAGRGSGKKRKFDPLVPAVKGSEKEKNLRVLESIAAKAPRLDMAKAVGRQINDEDGERSQEKQKGKGRGKGAKKGKSPKRAGKGHFKNRGGGPRGKSKGGLPPKGRPNGRAAAGKGKRR